MIPSVTTERLVLRAPRLADFDAYAAFRASPRASFVGGPNSRIDAWGQFCASIGHWDLRGFGRWIVTEAGRDYALGIVGLYFPEGWPEPEVAWSMFEGGEGKGYAYEAAHAARAYAYDTLGWTRVISMIDPANARSAALGRRLGCVPESEFVHEVYGAMQVWRHPSPTELAA